jgi:hypothetical protein
MDSRRVFRRHWLIKLALPGLPWLILVALVSLAVVYCLPYSRYAPVLFAFALLPLRNLLRLYLTWLDYSVSISNGSKVLVERSGLLSVSERRVPLTEIATVEYERPWWAPILGIDVGDAIVGAMGADLVLSSMGDFSDLWAVIESKGRVVPPKRPSALAALLELLGRYAPVLLRAIFTGLSFLVSSMVSLGHSAIDRVMRRFSEWASFLTNRLHQATRGPATVTGFDSTVNARPEPSSTKARRSRPVALHPDLPDGGYIYKGASFSPVIPSYPGFCAFCEQFLLTDKNWTSWRYRIRDASRLYYPDSLSDRVARSYLSRLRQACIVIPGPNGASGERLSCRIHSIEDIQCLVPDFPEPIGKAAQLR